MTTPPVPQRPTRLLVVDDEEISGLQLQRQLERNGFEVTRVYGGDEALAALQVPAGKRPDAVLLDVMMPGKSGLEVLAEIRAKHPAVDLPVLMCTGRELSSDIIDALRLGANDYLVKPVNAAVASARIRAQLDIVRLTRERAERDALVALGAMVVTYNHEINNPLTVAICQLESALKARSPEQAAFHFAKVRESLDRIAATVRKVAALPREGFTLETYVGSTQMIRLK